MTTLNQNEVDKFSAIASEWWNENGKFKPLHCFNPIRLQFISKHLAEHFKLNINQHQFLTGLSLIDIGCGGGLVAEPMANLGAEVLAIDASATNIEVAKIHAKQSNLAINYKQATPEQIAQENQHFDVVLALEVIEHVKNIELFLQACSNLLKPGGILFVATINRNLKSLLFAKFGVEYVLRWLPIGTHHWHKFLKPAEIVNSASKFNLNLKHLQGFSYNIFTNTWQESHNIDINYCLSFTK